MQARVVSLYVSKEGSAESEPPSSIDVALDGVVGDSHQSFERIAYDGDKQPEGTVRRNERQWSAVSSEELESISTELGLDEPVSASCLGANLCLEGVTQLSRLPKGTILKFPSGAELMVEEYNPPCHYMGTKVAERYTKSDGNELRSTEFSRAAKLMRGIVGTVEVAGPINVGDRVEISLYETPSWLVRGEDQSTSGPG